MSNLTTTDLSLIGSDKCEKGHHYYWSMGGRFCECKDFPAAG